MNSKKKLGQFYTTNYEYILNGLEIPNNIKKIIEPFAGNGDLLNFISNNIDIEKEFYDIEPKKDYIIKRNTILEPPNYNNAFILTNPPYLARNKSIDKTLYNKYKVNDLYKCFIIELLSNKCLGGIIIIPLNFWCSIRNTDIELRKKFLEIYEIILLNIFEEQVFDDTNYTICSFQFQLKKDNINNEINIMIYPNKINIKTELNENNNYMIGGSIYNLPILNKYKINRITNKNINNSNRTNILVKCIDDNKDNKIKLSYVDDNNIYIDTTSNQSSRTYATLIIEPKIDKEKQLKLIELFNNYLNDERIKYNSLFLTNYRESKKDIARKRISFELVYLISSYILEKII